MLTRVQTPRLEIGDGGILTIFLIYSKKKKFSSDSLCTYLCFKMWALHVYILSLSSVDENDSQSLAEFMDALQNTKEVDTENNRLSVPQTMEDRITLGR